MWACMRGELCGFVQGVSCTRGELCGHVCGVSCVGVYEG